MELIQTDFLSKSVRYLKYALECDEDIPTIPPHVIIKAGEDVPFVAAYSAILLDSPAGKKRLATTIRDKLGSYERNTIQEFIFASESWATTPDTPASVRALLAAGSIRLEDVPSRWRSEAVAIQYSRRFTHSGVKHWLGRLMFSRLPNGEFLNWGEEYWDYTDASERSGRFVFDI